MTLVIAHRGASAYQPENTMPAFEEALRQGADMIELDVQRSADGVLVVYHDMTTAQWNQREQRVTECTLKELQALTIRTPDGVRTARVATLVEVCDFARAQNLRMNIELKGLGIAADVARTLHATRAEELTLISSFSPVALGEMAQAAPQLPRGYLMGTRTLRPGVRFRESWPFAALRHSRAQAWHPVYQVPLLRRVIPRVKRLGYAINVWTVNNPKMMQRLSALGVDGIITDVPDVLRAVLTQQSATAYASGKTGK